MPRTKILTSKEYLFRNPKVNFLKNRKIFKFSQLQVYDIKLMESSSSNTNLEFHYEPQLVKLSKMKLLN